MSSLRNSDWTRSQAPSKEEQEFDAEQVEEERRKARKKLLQLSGGSASPTFATLRSKIKSVWDIDTNAQTFKANLSVNIVIEEDPSFVLLENIYEIFQFHSLSEWIFEPKGWKLDRTFSDKDSIMHLDVSGIFRAHFNLGDFPFDVQRIEILITSNLSLERLQFGADAQTSIIWDGDGDDKYNEWHIEKQISLQERFTDKSLSLAGSVYHEVLISFKITRNWTFYFWNVYLIYFAVVSSSFAVASIPADSDNGSRLSIIVTLLLTAVAFKQSGRIFHPHVTISANLPKVPYNTKLDHYILGCFFFLSLAILENAIACRWHSLDTFLYISLAVGWIAFNIFSVLEIMYKTLPAQQPSTSRAWTFENKIPAGRAHGLRRTPRQHRLNGEKEIEKKA